MRGSRWETTIRDGMSATPDALWFEDLWPGRCFNSPEMTAAAADIAAFAANFDPQALHLDSAAANRWGFRDVIASGWHTASLTMRLMLESDMRLSAGSIGLGVEKLRWRRPVFAGDRLTARIKVSERRESHSRPLEGVAKLHVATSNQRAEVVMDARLVILVRRRPPAEV